MGKGYFGIIKKLYDRPVDALGLSFFRIAYSLVLLLEVKQIFTFRELIFSEVSSATPSLITGLLVLWALVLVFLLAGCFTCLAAGLNYIIGIFIVWQMPAFKYHLDFVMTTVNFLLLFLPVSAGLSLDRYLGIRQHPEENIPDQLSSLYVWVLVILGLGLVYLDSAVNKLSSPIWLSGLGFWLPSSLPLNGQTNLSWLLNQQFLVRVIGYVILIFEILFIFLIWFRPLRWFLLIIGVLLHLGIGIAYPIPNFALLMLTLYIPLLPDAVWQKLRLACGQKIRENNFSENSYASTNTIRQRNSNSYLIALFLMYALLGQFMCMLAAPVVQESVAHRPVKKIIDRTQSLFKPFYFINQKFLGIVSHDIFLDKHFANFNQIINIYYTGNKAALVPLPLFTQTGQPGTYSTGRIWTKWAYRVTGAKPDSEKLSLGIKNFTYFWAQQQGVSLDKAVFIIQVKNIKAAHTWEKDFLNRQMQQPWVPVGRVYWQNQQCRIEWLPKANF